MPVTVAETDRERFVTLVLNEFKTLHADNAIRFGLRPLEFAVWKPGRGEEPRSCKPKISSNRTWV